MSKSDKSFSPYKKLLKWTAILAAVAAVCWVAVEGISAYSRSALDKKIAEVKANNKNLETQYLVDRAEYENATLSGKSQLWPEAPSEGVGILDLSAYPIESASFQTVSRNTLLEGGLMLVNHWHYLPSDFSEENIKSVREWTNSRVPIRDNNIELFRPAAEAIDTMVVEAKILGMENFIVQNAFRTMADQQGLFDKQVGDIQAKNSKISVDQAIEQAKKSVNYPGTSEYQTGFAFEMKLYNREDAKITGTKFQDSDQGKWFNENCWKYGVIFRFPTAGYPTEDTEDKSYKTGNASKLNIYRYVGTAHSTAMKILNMCLEEYIEYLIATPHIAIFDNGKIKYEIYRQPYEGGDAMVQVPLAATSYVSSIDNMGGVVTAYYYE